MKSIEQLIYLGIILWGGGQPVAAQAPKTTPKSEKRFSIAVLSDTQYYTTEGNQKKGWHKQFEAQTEWIVDNYAKEGIAYVVHVGDITENGDEAPAQWKVAADALYTLEQPLPGMPHGVPYGLAIGNHDQFPGSFAVTGTTIGYNRYFGVKHFAGRPYYGGHFGSDNDSHYDLFSGGGQDFLAIYVEFDPFDEQQDRMNDWVVEVLENHRDRKAIIVSHYLLENNAVAGTNLGGRAPFGKQGSRLYDRIKGRSNVFLMLCGHVGANGEGYRQDTHNGFTIKSMLSDYQSRAMGGNGMMRLLTFDLEKDIIEVRSFSPYHQLEETDADSRFTVPLFREASASRIYDFDLDGRSDLYAYKAGNWVKPDGRVGFSNWHSGESTAPSYYQGNGQTMPAIYNPFRARFLMGDGSIIPLGNKGDVPVPADYDGDGIAELAVWNPPTATWLIQGKDPVQYGWEASVPVPADYDGDGRAELAVWRFSDHTWHIEGIGAIHFGQEGDVPVPADYDGDGKVDVAVWRPTTGEWLFFGRETSFKLGKKGDVPIPGDYEGTGKVQVAVFDPTAKKVRFQNGNTLDFNCSADEIVNLPFAIKLYYLKLLKGDIHARNPGSPI